MAFAPRFVSAYGVHFGVRVGSCLAQSVILNFDCAFGMG